MPDWLEILLQCSLNIHKNILPLLSQPQAAISCGKGAGGDLTHRIDQVAENTIINTIKQYNIAFALISEEAGIKKFGESPHYYVTTDPIDGTTNALRGIPFIATSIAVSKKPQLKNIETALVTDLLHNITYTAEKGEGAFKNNKKITPSKTNSLEKSVLSIDFTAGKTSPYANVILTLLQDAKHPRHLGADALEICYVADGTIDAFIDIRNKLRVTDMAAAQLILVEAGGIITTPEGKKLNAPLKPTQRISFIAAANKTIHRKIKTIIKKGATKPPC